MVGFSHLLRGEQASICGCGMTHPDRRQNYAEPTTRNALANTENPRLLGIVCRSA
jgi:hypothetical protein